MNFDTKSIIFGLIAFAVVVGYIHNRWIGSNTSGSSSSRNSNNKSDKKARDTNRKEAQRVPQKTIFGVSRVRGKNQKDQKEEKTEE